LGGAVGSGRCGIHGDTACGQGGPAARHAGGLGERQQPLPGGRRDAWMVPGDSDQVWPARKRYSKNSEWNFCSTQILIDV
jgi:hypothetical protein